MGCRCREIRAVINRVPGGKFFTGLLPALPPKGPTMKMLAPVPGQSFNLANGSQYTAGDDRAIEVETQDVAEMRRVGCTPVLPATTAVTTPTWGTVTAAEAGEAAAEEPTEQ